MKTGKGRWQWLLTRMILSTGPPALWRAGPPKADHAVDVTDFLDKGIASLKAHKAYIENLAGGFDPEAFLQNNASATGNRFGCPFAVGFEVMKI
jgi:hypothetical protein